MYGILASPNELLEEIIIRLLERTCTHSALQLFVGEMDRPEKDISPTPVIIYCNLALVCGNFTQVMLNLKLDYGLS